MTRAELDAIRARRRAPLELEIAHAPSPAARERLIDMLVELLDPRHRSGRA